MMENQEKSAMWRADHTHLTERIAQNFAAWQEDMAPNFSLCLMQAESFGRHTAHLLSSDNDKYDLRLLAADFDRTIPRNSITASSAMSLMLRLSFCRGFLESTPMPLSPAQPVNDIISSPVRIAMLDNALFSAAAEQFSAAIGPFTPLMAPSFRNVCEELENETASFGILPLEDEREGRLYHFYALIDQFELHIWNTCDVILPNSELAARFALLSRHAPPLHRVQGESILECTLFEENGETLSALLSAAESCGLSLRRIDSLPAIHGQGGFFYRLVFLVGDGNATLFETYLTCFVPRSAVTGRYLHLLEQ